MSIKRFEKRKKYDFMLWKTTNSFARFPVSRISMYIFYTNTLGNLSYGRVTWKWRVKVTYLKSY